jgi:uncharacterized SAM-binding protein YcdF (DUF218 family)
VAAPSSPPRRTFRRTLAAVALILGALAAYAFTQVGRFLAEEDPIQHADAIAVLAGTRLDRPMEAVDLYKAGYAPRIVLTYGMPEASFAALAAHNIPYPAEADEARDILMELGIPVNAIILPPRIHDNTAQEAQTFRALAEKNGWRRIIVVTSRYHLRRAGFAIRREMAGTGVEIEMHGTRYEPVDPDRWWTTRVDLRWVLDEGAKLIAYELGLGAGS